jgi:hypothetical protein
MITALMPARSAEVQVSGPYAGRAGRPGGGNPAGAAVRYDQNSAAAAESED